MVLTERLWAMDDGSADLTSFRRATVEAANESTTAITAFGNLAFAFLREDADFLCGSLFTDIASRGPEMIDDVTAEVVNCADCGAGRNVCFPGNDIPLYEQCADAPMFCATNTCKSNDRYRYEALDDLKFTEDKHHGTCRRKQKMLDDNAFFSPQGSYNFAPSDEDALSAHVDEGAVPQVPAVPMEDVSCLTDDIALDLDADKTTSGTHSVNLTKGPPTLVRASYFQKRSESTILVPTVHSTSTSTGSSKKPSEKTDRNELLSMTPLPGSHKPWRSLHGGGHAEFGQNGREPPSSDDQWNQLFPNVDLDFIKVDRIIKTIGTQSAWGCAPWPDRTKRQHHDHDNPARKKTTGCRYYHGEASQQEAPHYPTVICLYHRSDSGPGDVEISTMKPWPLRPQATTLSRSTGSVSTPLGVPKGRFWRFQEVKRTVRRRGSNRSNCRLLNSDSSADKVLA